jgi:pimeloyl-ACP methyl ester carboxylesterase
VEYTGRFFVRQIHQILNHLKITTVTLVGNSLGGILALLYALVHPEGVNGLVLVASGGFHQWTEKQRADALSRFSKENLTKLSPARHEKLFFPLFVNGDSEVRTRYIEKQNAKLTRPDFPAYVNSLHSSVNVALDEILLDRLDEIEARVLLLHGEKDQVLLRAWTERALPIFKSAELKVIPGCGHVPQLERPAEVVKAIEAFTASLRS